MSSKPIFVSIHSRVYLEQLSIVCPQNNIIHIKKPRGNNNNLTPPLQRNYVVSLLRSRCEK